MNININQFLTKLLPYMLAIFMAYLICVILFFYLPKTPPTILDEDKHSLSYRKYKLYDSFKEKVIKSKDIKVQKKEYQLIKNILLKAIFSLGSNKGFITISEKSSSKRYTLEVGEKFKDYTLKTIYPKYVIFNKGSNEYKLSLNEKKETYSVPKQKKKKLKTKDIVLEDNTYFLKKKLVDDYATNYEKIWKEIAIDEIKKDGEIDGFKISALSGNSIFKKIGLRVGDIIKSINNIELKSYADAFGIYKNMANINNLHVVLLRDKKEVELDYEIK